MDLGRVGWLLARLRAMPAREVFHRFVELFNKRLLTAKPLGRSRITVSSDIGFHFEPGISWLKDNQHCAFLSKSVLIEGPTIFGRLWQQSGQGEIEWHKSLSGDDFEHIKTFNVKYRSTDTWSTDIRQLWELNRLVWLLPVAQNFAETGNRDSGEYLKKTLASFFESDRPGYSIRWNSAIEIAVQALSLVSIEKILGNRANEMLPENYLAALETRLRWLERLPSKYSSENNHRVAEIAAQIAIYSRLRISKESKENCEIELSRLILNQFWADGFNKEQSFGYHLFTLDLIATAKVLVPDLSFSDEALQRLGMANQITFDLYSFCNFWPTANDSDEAQLLGALETSEGPPFILFSTVFGQPKLTQVKPKSLHLELAGYFFVKSYVDDLSLILMVDHGEMGLGPLYAHAHADSQAIWLWVDGNPVLVEAGTYTYHSSEELRKLLQGSLAHNSISIEERSIVEPLGPFLWDKSNFPLSLKFEYAENGDNYNISMSCELPLKHLGSGPAVWKRQIVFDGVEITIVDELVENYNYLFEPHLILDTSFEKHSENTFETRLESQSLIVAISKAGGDHSIEEFPFSPRYSHLSPGLKVKETSSDKIIGPLQTSIRIRRKS